MPEPGSRVKVITKDSTEEGILIPSPDLDVILIKLDNGYNMGFPKKSAKIEILEKPAIKNVAKKEVPKNSNLPTISILHTGGTIASKVDYRTGGVVSSFEPAELISLFPELKSIANIESELISQMWSDDLRFKHFEIIAKKVQDHIKKGSVGIIIGIGTDNLAVAAAALSFIVESSPVPIIFVGSQRSSDRGSSDAGVNLICAAEFVTKSDFGGVGICLHQSANDDFCAILPGTKTYKLHSSRRDAFKPINSEAIAMVNFKTRKISYKTSYLKKSKQLKIEPKMEDRVGLLKIHVNMFPEQFELFQGYKGLIIEGTGLGHTPGQVPNKESEIHKKIYPAIKKVVDSGCVVVMTTQCIFGGVNMNVYDKGRDLQKLGVISGKDMLANTALVKLSWLLANEKDVKELMVTNLRGEINDTLKFEQEFI